MTHASAATDALRDAVAAAIRPVAAAVRQTVEAQAPVIEAEDMQDAMKATASMIVGLEAMEEAAKTAAARSRAALAEAMSLGLTQFRTATHTVSLKEGVPGAIITDPSQVPRELWSTPEPKPDKTEIAKRLRRGEVIPGAVLTNGSPPSVQIKRREAA